jgi:hypothetical protein
MKTTFKFMKYVISISKTRPFENETEFQFHMCVLIHLLHLIHMVFIQKFTRVDIILNENNEYINRVIKHV